MTPKPHFYPAAIPRSTIYQAKAQGLALDVLHHAADDHTSFECDGPVEIEIQVPAVPGRVFIRPLVQGIEAKITGNQIRFTLPSPQYLQIEIEGYSLLYIYAFPLAEETPTGP